MRLIVTKDMVEPFRAPDGGRISISISPNDVHFDDCYEDEGRELVQEIFDSKPSSWDIELLYHSDPINAFKFLLKCTTENNVLRKLRERFQNEVTIAVDISSFSLVDGYSRAIISEEMIIDITNFTCQSRTSEEPYMSAMIERRGWSFLNRLNITIIAEIAAEIHLYATKLPVSQKILAECLFTDVVISTGSGTEVKAHKCFLAAISVVLRKKFGSETVKSQTDTLDMTDMSEKGVRALLRYIYLEELEEHNKSIELAYELFCAARKYDISKLEKSMKEYLLNKDDKDFTVELVFIMYQYLRAIESATELKAKTVRILISNVTSLDELPGFSELFLNAPDAAKELCTEFANVALKEKVSLQPQPKLSVFQKLLGK